MSYPFAHYPNPVGGSYFFNYEFATVEDAPLGETAFKGAIGPDSGNGEKIILSYLSEQFDSFEFKNGNLVGRELSSLEYIEYSLKDETCPGTPPASECPELFPLTVYTKDTTTDPNQSCRFLFVPSGDSIVGAIDGWTIVRITDLTVPSSVECSTTGFVCGGTATSCESSADPNPNTMNALAPNHVLGNSDNEIFTLNIGTDTTDDENLVGYLDKIVVKIEHEDGPRVYDL